ncbi:MAG: hypothetical protein U1F43_33095 [Myxococcota bacterium]
MISSLSTTSASSAWAFDRDVVVGRPTPPVVSTSSHSPASRVYGARDGRHVVLDDGHLAHARQPEKIASARDEEGAFCSLDRRCESLVADDDGAYRTPRAIPRTAAWIFCGAAGRARGDDHQPWRSAAHGPRSAAPNALTLVGVFSTTSVLPRGNSSQLRRGLEALLLEDLQFGQNGMGRSLSRV